ncbi:MAG: hypothetical protein R3F04_04080 [Lysobacteraceae bacterium]
MKSLIVATLVGLLAMSGVAANDEPDVVVGTLFVTYNMGVGSETESKLSARFVPVDTHFPAPLNDPEPRQSVRHFNVENAGDVVNGLLGQAELERLSNDSLRIVAVPVTATIERHRRVIECDAPADYATLLFVRALKPVQAVSRDDAPIGC